MSKSAMLRTRRRDVNVKPNRRLDRKSSRGMIYENEELRLRTININAEIERGQSDIKKLRRENEQLRKEIWCLRDEYDKLDKLLKEKDGSCSSCTSETDSCDSCTESEETETTQNLENVQKTTLNCLRTEFDHLSVVTEETSADNSDKNSNPAQSPKDPNWDIIPPDQSYPNSLPNSRCSTLPMGQAPKHFFAPLKTSKSYENCTQNGSYCPSSWSLEGNSNNWFGADNSADQFVKLPNSNSFQKFPPTPKIPQQHNQEFYNFDTSFPEYLPKLNHLPKPKSSLKQPQILTKPNNIQSQPTPGNNYPNLQTCQKTSTDILVKTESFPSDPSSFTNGGNLEELLQDIGSISQDILENDSNLDLEDDLKKPYKSEINVVLMPKPMPLLGFDKYQNIKSSLESLTNLPEKTGGVVPRPLTPKSIEKTPRSTPILKPIDVSSKNISPITNNHVIPRPVPSQNILHQNLPNISYPDTFPFQPRNIPPPLNNPSNDLTFTPTPVPEQMIIPKSQLARQPSNPFFYGSFGSYQNTESISNRFKPDNFGHDNFGFKQEVLPPTKPDSETDQEKSNIKSNLENENAEKSTLTAGDKSEKSETEKSDDKGKKEEQKSPKHRRTRKVSIYFKGKKEKLARSLSLDTKLTRTKSLEHSENPDKSKTEIPKTPSSLDSKISYDKAENSKPIDSDTQKTSSDSKLSPNEHQRSLKHRKSSSTSPERRHLHVKLETDAKKCHKKRHRKSERRLQSRNSIDRTGRERSNSICTERSNILDHKFGHFDHDYTNSERDRSNSLSSCETIKSRRMTIAPQFDGTGKIPWFGCWGNGCL